MDINDIKNQVSNLSLYDIKAGFRKAQNAVMNYTEMESKVREATNNEPWGASSTTMQEIANATFSYQTLNEIMPMIYRRFTEKSAEEWRQIYKAQQLLEFLIKHGSERVVDDARGHITLLKMLRQFQFIDLNGKDQGINVRNRAKELTELLGDVDRIRTERKKARATKSKYTGVEGGVGGGFSGSSRYGGFGSESGGYGGGGGGGGGGPADFGGYSGGVYGDGGGFGGQTDGWREDGGGTSGGQSAAKFEAYDEYDEAPAASSSRPPRQSTRSSAKAAAEAPKKKAKEPEVDLFSFDEPEPSSSAAPTASSSAGLAGFGTSAANDEDDFDDFQSATPAGNGLSQPLSHPITSTASSTTQFASPQPLSAPQQAGISQMVSMSSISPAPSNTATPSANYSSFAAPAQPTQPAKPANFAPSGPNYFTSVQLQSGGAQPTGPAGMGMSGMSSNTTNTPTTMANMKPVTSSSGKSAAPPGGDAFGALWGKASSGIKKSETPTSGPAMGQLAKEKSSAGIWGVNAPAGSQPPAGSGSASNDLLF